MLDGGAGVDPDAVEWELNEWDEFSLEVALQLSEAQGDGEVVVISIGDEEAEEGLRACLAKGADRALRVWEDQLDGLRPPVGGSRAGRRGRAGVARPGAVRGPVERRRPQRDRAWRSRRISGCRAWPWSRRSSTTPRSGSATVERELEGGLVELLRVGLPALLTIQTGINEPRYANLRAIKQAKEKPLEVLGSIGVGARRGRRRGGGGLARTLHGSARFGRWGGDAQRLALCGGGADRRDREGSDERMSGILVVAESRRGELA